MSALQGSGIQGSTVPHSAVRITAWLFRAALFGAAASLAAYIIFKYATQLHAITGLYAFLFPLSSALAAAGIVLAVRPKTPCDCSVAMRGGFGALAILWLATGVICVPSLLELSTDSPASGAFATFHMVAQHVFLSGSVLAFALAPRAMLRLIGMPVPVRAPVGESAGSTLVRN